MRVLVTGATGVLGRRLLPLLSAEGHRVTAVSRGRQEQVREAGADPVELDLFDADAVRCAVEGHDVVLDLATRIPSTNRTPLPWAWRDNDRLRSATARTMADAAIAVGARYVRESFATARRGIAPVLGDPSGFQPHVHLDDAASAVVAALDVPAGVYNVVEDDPLRRRELVEVFEQLAGRRLRTPPRVLTRFGPMRTLGRSVRLDNAKLRAATTWEPTYPRAREGLPAVAAEVSSR